MVRWRRYGPCILAVFAAILIVLDPIRHVLMDHASAEFPWLVEYRSDCKEENWSCLAAAGWAITVGCTYVGFFCMALSTMWNASILEKCSAIRERFRELRAGRK